jgi:hypothetical protein
MCTGEREKAERIKNKTSTAPKQHLIIKNCFLHGPLKKPMNFFEVIQISASSFCREKSKLQPRFCNRKTIICISIYWFPFFEAITLALLLIATAEIKKPCCLVHNTADEPRFDKQQQSTMLQGHQTFVGLDKTMWGAELQDHILKEEGCTVLTRPLTGNNGELWERKKHWQKLDFPSQCDPAGYYVCGTLIKKQGEKKRNMN